MDDGVEGICVRFADDIKLGGIANTLEERTKIQNETNNKFRKPDWNELEKQD